MADEKRTRPGIDMLSQEVMADPYPTYERLRRDHPVCRIEPHGFWAVSRYRDVSKVLEDWETFESSAADELYRVVSPKPADSESPEQKQSPPRLILSQDPPEHGKYRGLVKKAFTDKATSNLVPLMRTTARSLLDNFNEETPVDFIEHYAYPYVRTIIDDLVGLDDRQSMADLREWLTFEEQVSLKQTDEGFVGAFSTLLEKQYAHFTAIMNERREDPRDDLITKLVNAKVDREKLSDRQICGLLCLLVSAGFMTSVHMLGNAVILLSRQPGLFDELRAAPDSIPLFVKELMRFSPSVLATVRTTASTAHIGGVEIPEGETVIPILAAANRDPEAFANPDSFDLARRNAGASLSFGYGIHTCLGAALARLELRITLETLLDCNARFVCPPDEGITRIQTLFIRGISRLPVRLY